MRVKKKKRKRNKKKKKKERKGRKRFDALIGICADASNNGTARHATSVHLLSFVMLIVQPDFPSTRSERGNTVRLDRQIDKAGCGFATVENFQSLTTRGSCSFRFNPRTGGIRDWFRMIACWVLTGVFGAIVLLYGVIEVHYFLRMFFIVFFARFCKKRVRILDETTVYGTLVAQPWKGLDNHINYCEHVKITVVPIVVEARII